MSPGVQGRPGNTARHCLKKQKGEKVSNRKGERHRKGPREKQTGEIGQGQRESERKRQGQTDVRETKGQGTDIPTAGVRGRARGGGDGAGSSVGYDRVICAPTRTLLALGCHVGMADEKAEDNLKKTKLPKT